MDKRPLQVVLRRNLVELFLDEGNVFFHLFHVPVDVVGLDRGAGRDGAVDGHADIEMMLVGGLKRRWRRGFRPSHTSGQHAGKQQGGDGKGGCNDAIFHGRFRCVE